MKTTFFYLSTLIIGLAFLSACGSSNQQDEENSGDLTPVTESDRQRYNINEDTETVINLDSTHVDSTDLQQDYE